MFSASAKILKLDYSRWELVTLKEILKLWNDESHHCLIFERVYKQEKMVIFDTKLILV